MILFFVFFFVIGTIVHSKNVYVSYQIGSDSNDGTKNSPLKYCPGMNEFSGSLELHPGDTVFFSNTETWESNENWVLKIVGGVKYDGMSFGSGDPYSSRAVLKSLADCKPSVVIFQDDDENHETTFFGFEIDGNQQICQCISLIAPGEDLIGKTKRVENVIAHHCGVAYVQSYGDKGYCYGIIVGGYGGHKLHNVEVIDTEVYETGSTNLCCYPSWDGAYDNQVSNVLFKGNKIHDHCNSDGNGITIKNDCRNVVLENNVISHHGTGRKIETAISITTNANAHDFTYTGPSNVEIRNNLIMNTQNGIIASSNGLTHLGPTDLKIHNNIFWDIEGMSVRIRSALEASQKNQDFLIGNNLFYDSTDVYNPNWSRVLEMLSFYISGDNKANVNLHNNIFHVAQSQTKRIIAKTYGNNNGNFVTSNNLYYSSEGTGVLISDDTSSSFRESDIKSFEPTCVYGTPSYKDITNLPTSFINQIPNNDGLSLLNQSIARNAGMDLDIARISINQMTRKDGEFDIGPYQYTVSTTPPNFNYVLLPLIIVPVVLFSTLTLILIIVLILFFTVKGNLSSKKKKGKV